LEGGRRLRACTHYLSRLIGGAVREITHPWLFECCDSVAGRRAPGIAAALVQAKDAAAKAFYLGQAEWLEVPADGRTMWLPVGEGCGGVGE